MLRLGVLNARSVVGRRHSAEPSHPTFRIGRDDSASRTEREGGAAADALPGATVALLPWGNLWERDFLDTIGISDEEFRRAFRGSFIFGYAKALERVGLRPVVICFSDRVEETTRFQHGPTGVAVSLIPAGRLYRVLRRRVEAWDGGDGSGASPAARLLRHVLRDICEYLATPPRRLRRELERRGCGAIVCQEYEYARFDVCVLVGRWARIPVFATFQGGGERRLGPLERRFRRGALQRAAGLVVAPEDEARRLRLRYAVPRRRMLQIFNPVDVNFWRPLEREAARSEIGLSAAARIVVWHGRVSVFNKGLDTVVAAWRRLRQRPDCNDCVLVLVGTGSGAATLHRLVAQEGVDNVRWLDRFVHNPVEIRRLLCAANLYVFPSRREGFAVAPLEAMACGLPVVAAAASGVEEMFGDSLGSTGTLVPCGDATTLADAMVRFLVHPDLCRRAGAAARELAVRRFGEEVVGRQLKALLAGHPEASTLYSNRHDTASHSRQDLRLDAVSPGGAVVGTDFRLRDGDSTLVLSTRGATRGTLARVGSVLVTTTFVSPQRLLAALPGSLLRSPSSHGVHLTDGVRVSQELPFRVASKGTVEVLAPARARDDRSARSLPPELLRLHPASTPAGEGFNTQANGESAIAVDCLRAEAETLIVFGGVPLPTTYVDAGVLTAFVPRRLYRRPGRVSVFLLGTTEVSDALEFRVTHGREPH